MNKNIKYSQNFLTSEKVLNQIIKQLNLKETDIVNISWHIFLKDITIYAANSKVS